VVSQPSLKQETPCGSSGWEGSRQRALSLPEAPFVRAE